MLLKIGVAILEGRKIDVSKFVSQLIRMKLKSEFGNAGDTLKTFSELAHAYGCCFQSFTLKTLCERISSSYVRWNGSESSQSLHLHVSSLEHLDIRIVALVEIVALLEREFDVLFRVRSSKR